MPDDVGKGAETNQAVTNIEALVAQTAEDSFHNRGAVQLDIARVSCSLGQLSRDDMNAAVHVFENNPINTPGHTWGASLAKTARAMSQASSSFRM
jgi:hypothetical protein